jgi:plasmid stabilization system protein ParE
MAKITLHARVIARLHEIEEFYQSIDEELASRALNTLFRWFEKISKNPAIGRLQLSFPDIRQAEVREAVVPFGQSGFIALYRYLKEQDEIIILALRHQRERGFREVDFDAP